MRIFTRSFQHAVCSLVVWSFYELLLLLLPAVDDDDDYVNEDFDDHPEYSTNDVQLTAGCDKAASGSSLSAL